MKNGIEQRTFEGNIQISISDKEVRLWVCNQKGENIFRFKALGKVHKAGQDITILSHLFNEENYE